MKKATFLISFMMLLVGVQLWAAPISVTKAKKIAEEMALFKPISRQGAPTLKCIYANSIAMHSTDITAPYYVFSPDTGNGFVIISGDDELAPLVGYSVDNTFDVDRIPEQLKALLADYVTYVSAVQSGEINAPYISPRPTNGVVVAPMIKAKWDQGAPYNNLCSPYVTGCVATAMAQIMSYYKWPSEANASLDDVRNNYNVIYQRPIDWNNMLDEYNEEWNESTDSWEPRYTTIQANAVANLMSQCGVSVVMNYGTRESSAFSFSVGNALRKYYKYSPKVMTHYRNDYSNNDWMALLRSNLEQHMPLLYSGQGDGGGHAFVCDGIDAQDLLHINWGWGGYCDGYFDVCYMNPSGVGIGGGTGAFNRAQEVITGIKPLAADEVEMTEIPAILTLSKFRAESPLVLSKSETNGSFSFVMGEVWDLTDTQYDRPYRYGIVLVDKNGNIISTKTNSVRLKSGRGNLNVWFSLTMMEDFYDKANNRYLPNGDYEIIPVMFNFEDNYPTHISSFTRMICNGAVTSFKATITDTEVIIKNDKILTPYDLWFTSIEPSSKLYVDTDNQQVTIKVKNKGATNYEGSITAYYIHESIDDSNIDVMYRQPQWSANCVIYGDKDIDIYTKIPQLSLPGKYKVRIIYQKGPYESAEMPSETSHTITVFALPDSPILTIESSLNIYYYKDDRRNNFLQVTANVKANKTYNGPIQLIALREGDTENNEILLLEDIENITTTGKWIENIHGYSINYFKMNAGKYNLYLKYLFEDERIRMNPDYYNSFLIELGEIPSDIPGLSAPLVINNSLPILDGQVFKVETTLMSKSGYKGTISASAPYVDIDGNWTSAAYLNNKEVDLKPNEPQTLEFTGQAYRNVPPGNYTMTFNYKHADNYYEVPFNDYASSSIFEITDTPFVLSAPLVINEGHDVQQGSKGKVHITLQGNMNYPGGYFYIQDDPQVMKGEKTYVESLPYKQDKVIELNYTCDNNAIFGEHTLSIVYNHPITQNVTPLYLGEHSNSAKFNVIASTGLTEKEANNIYTYQKDNGFSIKGLLGGEDIIIYDNSGNILLQRLATGDDTFIAYDKLNVKNCIVVIKNGEKQAIIKVSLK